MHIDSIKTNLLIRGKQDTLTLQIKGEHNTECQIKSGVLQASLPGVLLFKIYSNYICVTLLKLTFFILPMIITFHLSVT